MNMILPRQSRSEDEFVPPSDRLISSLPGTYYKLSEVSILVGRSEASLRRLMRKRLLKAPSYQVDQGKNTYYLYTPEDVAEIKHHYEQEATVRKRVDDDDQDQAERDD